MQRKTIILIVIILIITIAGFILIYVNTPRDQRGDDTGSNIEIIPGSGDNLDVLEAENQGETSLIKNVTHNYSIRVPNNWSIENQVDAIKLYPKISPENTGNCLLTTVAFDSNGMTPEDLINRNREFAVEEVKNAGPVSIQNHSGLIQQELQSGRIVSETAYVEVGTKIYSISSFYEDIHGQTEKADYNTCHPLFEDLLSTLTIN